MPMTKPQLGLIDLFAGFLLTLLAGSIHVVDHVRIAAACFFGCCLSLGLGSGGQLGMLGVTWSWLIPWFVRLGPAFGGFMCSHEKTSHGGSRMDSGITRR